MQSAPTDNTSATATISMVTCWVVILLYFVSHFPTKCQPRTYLSTTGMMDGWRSSRGTQSICEHTPRRPLSPLKYTFKHISSGYCDQMTSNHHHHHTPTMMLIINRLSGSSEFHLWGQIVNPLAVPCWITMGGTPCCLFWKHHYNPQGYNRRLPCTSININSNRHFIPQLFTRRRGQSIYTAM